MNGQVNMKKSSNEAKKPWTHLLYVKYANLYLPELLAMDAKAESEVNGICKIFNEFNITKKSRILDFSCGIGRHSIRLSKIGYQVVGYDPSYLFIRKAREKVKIENKNLRVNYYVGDPYSVSKLLPSKGQSDFDAIIIMYNSIGYATPEEDIQIFKSLLGLASERGSILITQTENRDWRIKNFQPSIITDYDTTQLHEQWKFNMEDSIFHGGLKFYRKQSHGLNFIRNIDIHLRLYSLHELKQILHKSGWSLIKSYGNIRTLEPASTDSSEIITVSTNKPGVHSSPKK